MPCHGTRGGLALVVLWQFLCIHMKVSGFNHFMHEGQYNYSRAVGTAAWWVMLVLLAGTPSQRWGRIAVWTAALGLACFALACHIAPGGVALGTLAIYGCHGFLRDRQARYLGLLAGTLLAGLLMFFGTDVWEYMSSNAGSDGWLPVGNLTVLLLWVPTLSVSCWRLVRALPGTTARSAGFSPPSAGTARRAEARTTNLAPAAMEALRIEPIVAAGLLSAGLFQAYLGFKMLVLGTCAPYAVKSLFFFTFPLASFLWILWGYSYLERFHKPAAFWAARLVPLAAVLLMAILGYRLVRMDPGMRWSIPQRADSHRFQRPAPEQLPHQVSEALRQLAGSYPAFYYFDPLQPTGAYYATLIGLGMEKELAQACFVKSKANPLEELPTIPGLDGILLPRFVDPASLAPAGTQVEKAGPFWAIRFHKARTTTPLSTASAMPTEHP